MAMAVTSVDIRTFTRRDPVPGVTFEKMAAHVLPGWDISLVFAGETRARSLNIALRKKDYVPNVLSYVSGKKSGEIIICPAVAARQAQSYGLSTKHFIIYLFIHGLFHLKGMPHGARMERYEQDALSRFRYPAPSFSPHEPSTSYGTTHRNGH